MTQEERELVMSIAQVAVTSIKITISLDETMQMRAKAEQMAKSLLERLEDHPDTAAADQATAAILESRQKAFDDCDAMASVRVANAKAQLETALEALEIIRNDWGIPPAGG